MLIKVLAILSVAAILGLFMGYVFSLLQWKKLQKEIEQAESEAAEQLSCGCSTPCSDDCEQPTLYQISEPKK